MKTKAENFIGVGCYISEKEHLKNSFAVAISEIGPEDLEILCAGTIFEKNICNYIIDLMDSILVHHSDYRIVFNANTFISPNCYFVKLFGAISLALTRKFNFISAPVEKIKPTRLIVGNNYFPDDECLDECLISVINADCLMGKKYAGEKYAAICAVQAIQTSYEI